MKWFKHDTDALQDAKVKKLVIKYGAIGYAIYFHCLELIAGDIDENNITFELEHDSEIIADDLHIEGTNGQSGQQIVEEIMKYIVHLNLFEESQGRIFCFKLLKRLDASMSSSKQFRKLIAEAKANHDVIMNNHDSIMTNHDSIMTNPDYIMQDIDIEIDKKENRDIYAKKFKPPTLEEVKEYCIAKHYTFDPERFWNFYESKGWFVGKTKMKNWKRSADNWNLNDNKSRRDNDLKVFSRTEFLDIKEG